MTDHAETASDARVQESSDALAQLVSEADRALRQLVERWRARALRLKGSEPRSIGPELAAAMTLDVCADELDAVLEACAQEKETP